MIGARPLFSQHAWAFPLAQAGHKDGHAKGAQDVSGNASVLYATPVAVLTILYKLACTVKEEVNG